MRWDVAIVGAGIVGLAHAYAAALRGLRTLVVERSSMARGASVRNFGLIWPVGQPLARRELALRSRTIWLKLIAEAGLWSHECGSLHLAYHDDEVAVLKELIQAASQEFCWLEARDISAKAARVRTKGLQGGMSSGAEICVDPRECLREIPMYLARRHGVELRYGCAATAAEPGWLWAGGERLAARQIFVCSGDDFETLFPSFFAAQSKLTRCKLQMMRAVSKSAPWTLGPALSAGASLLQYPIFGMCPSNEAVRRRFERDMPELLEHGIHVLVTQQGTGEITIGDSHELGLGVSPFCSTKIDTLILDYLRSFLDISGLDITSRWFGVYAKHETEAWLHEEVDDRIVVVTGVGGAGMTLALALGDAVVEHSLGMGELPSAC